MKRKGKVMRRIVFIFSVLFVFPAAAQDRPPECWEPYEFVQSYGTWSLKGNVWTMPFVCSSGVKASVNIARENVMNLGYAEYYIQAPGIENDNTFFYTAPCDAMGEFCEYVSMPRENVPSLYFLEN